MGRESGGSCGSSSMSGRTVMFQSPPGSDSGEVGGVDGSDSSSSGSALSLSGGGGGGNFEPTLYGQRWVQLGLLSLLALLSDLVCFSMAAAPETWSNVYGHNPTDLVDMFLVANVMSCLAVTDLTRLLGLRKVIVGAAALMSTGCLLRSGVPLSLLFPTGGAAAAATAAMPSYGQELFGTILVGIAQPFFQCTPPLLSATWFGAKERALSTAVAINFNQVGIGSAFLLGGALAGPERGAEGLAAYFGLITLACIAVTATTALGFQVGGCVARHIVISAAAAAPAAAAPAAAAAAAAASFHSSFF